MFSVKKVWGMSLFFPVHYFDVLILLNRSAANFYPISKNIDGKFWKWEKLEISCLFFSRLFRKSRFLENFEKTKFSKNRKFSKTWFFDFQRNFNEKSKNHVFENFRKFINFFQNFRGPVWAGKCACSALKVIVWSRYCADPGVRRRFGKLMVCPFDRV